MIDMRYHFNLNGDSDWIEAKIPDENFVPRRGDLINHTVKINGGFANIRRLVKNVERVSQEGSMNVLVLVTLEDESNEKIHTRTL